MPPGLCLRDVGIIVLIGAPNGFLYFSSGLKATILQVGAINENPDLRQTAEIWVLTDGRAGNEAQAMALAEAVGRRCRTKIVPKPITLKRWAAMVPAGVSASLGASRKGWPFSGLAEGGDALHWPWPDLVVGAGRRSAPIVAAIRRLHAVTAVQILNPRMPSSAFDAVIAPSHDGLTGANVLSTLGAMSRLTPDIVASSAADWDTRVTHVSRPRLAVVVGGPSKSAKFGTADQRNLLLALQTLQSKHGLLVTTSRRTSPDFAAQLAETLGAKALVYTGEGENPYPAILGLADAVLVTEDSVNMASEAASTGLPVHIFPIGGVATKLARFHEELASRGASRRFTGEIDEWSYEPLAEADRIAADLERRGIV